MREPDVTTETSLHSEPLAAEPPLTNEDAEAMLLRNLPLIASIARRVARARRMKPSQIEDFLADVIVRLIDRDYAILKQFRHQSSLYTFLHVVIGRICLDLYAAEWGRWRPSVRSRRAGPIVVLLERLTMRAGLSFDEACAVLRTERVVGFDTQALASHHRRFMARRRARFVGTEAMHDEPIAPSSAEQLVLDAEANRTLDEAMAVLAVAFASLAKEDQAVLTLRFRDNWSIAAIALYLQLDQKRLYRRLAFVLKQLRKAFEASHVSRRDVLAAVGNGCSNAASVLRPVAVELPYAKAS